MILENIWCESCRAIRPQIAFVTFPWEICAVCEPKEFNRFFDDLGLKPDSDVKILPKIYQPSKGEFRD